MHLHGQTRCEAPPLSWVVAWPEECHGGVHALAYGLTLVTADRAFERLRLTRGNWLA